LHVMIKLLAILGLSLLPTQSLLGAPAAVANSHESPRMSIMKKSDIVLLDLDTGEQRNLTNDDAPDFQPAFSPDGTRIAYASDHGQGYDIWVISVEGGEAINLTPDSPGEDFGPAWAPDGTRIAFCRREVGRGLSGIMEIDLDTGEVKRLTPEGVHAVLPAFRPGSEELYFTYFGGSPGDSTVGLAKLTAEGDVKWVLNRSNLPFLVQTSFDGLGFQLATRGNTIGLGEIFMINTIDSSIVNMTDHPAEDRDPVLAKDGRHIYFTSDRERIFRLYRLDTETLAVEPLKSFGADDHVQPALSPSEKHVAFVMADVMELQEFSKEFPIISPEAYQVLRRKDAYQTRISISMNFLGSAWRARHQIGGIILGGHGELIGGPGQKGGEVHLSVVRDGERLAAFETQHFAGSNISSDPVLYVESDGSVRFTPGAALARRLGHDTFAYDGWPSRTRIDHLAPLPSGLALAPTSVQMAPAEFQEINSNDWFVRTLENEAIGVQFHGPPSRQAYWFTTTEEGLVVSHLAEGEVRQVLSVRPDRTMEAKPGVLRELFNVSGGWWPVTAAKGVPCALPTGVVLQSRYFASEQGLSVYSNGTVGYPIVDLEH
jgi:hypothetical protein